jgi:ribosomal-protein-alanine N-acetyltransferase
MKTVRNYFPINLRFMKVRDLSEVLRIERGCFSYPWEESDFRVFLRQQHCIGTVAEMNGKIAGFMLYELHKNQTVLIDFAVDTPVRRMRVGTAMMDCLIRRLNDRRNRILLDVVETNLAAQLFFRSTGMRAIRVLKSPFTENDRDAYVFQYRRKRDDCSIQQN